jgi:hypothetical protein
MKTQNTFFDELVLDFPNLDQKQSRALAGGSGDLVFDGHNWITHGFGGGSFGGGGAGGSYDSPWGGLGAGQSFGGTINGVVVYGSYNPSPYDVTNSGSGPSFFGGNSISGNGANGGTDWGDVIHDVANSTVANIIGAYDAAHDMLSTGFDGIEYYAKSTFTGIDNLDEAAKFAQTVDGYNLNLGKIGLVGAAFDFLGGADVVVSKHYSNITENDAAKLIASGAAVVAVVALTGATAPIWGTAAAVVGVSSQIYQWANKNHTDDGDANFWDNFK